MKKILSSLVLVSLLVMPAMVLAAPPLEEVPVDLDIMDLLNTIANWLLTILLIVAAIFIIIAGFLFVTAMGDPEKVKTARNFILWALIGVLVALASKGLVLLIRSIVTG